MFCVVRVALWMCPCTLPNPVCVGLPHSPPILCTNLVSIARRLAFWFAMSLPATREYYAYVADERVSPRKRLGPNLWLSLSLATAEVLVVVKFARDTEFPTGWWQFLGRLGVVPD